MNLRGGRLDADVWEAASPVMRFVLALDARDAARVASAFAPDGRLEAFDGTTHTGRETIEAYYAARTVQTGRSKHLLTPVAEAERDGVTWSMWYALVVLETAPGSENFRTLTGTYEFEVDATGQIARMALELDASFQLTP
jgi:hypothetical protein